MRPRHSGSRTARGAFRFADGTDRSRVSRAARTRGRACSICSTAFHSASAHRAHLNWLVARSPVRRIDLDESQWAESNRAAVRGFWEEVGAEYQPPLPSSTIETSVERAEGNMLHAVILHDAWQALPAPERRADRISHGLRELIGEIWDRAPAHDESVRVGMGLLCAAQEALSLDVLVGLAGWDHDERVRVLRKARQLLLEEPASGAGVEAYRPRHDWVRQLMVARLGASTMCGHHRTWADKLARWPAANDAMALRYALRHALTHRAATGDLAGSWQLAADMSFLGSEVSRAPA